MPARVFVSYRRSDSAEVVGRLVDRLNDRLGEEYVFRDVGSIEPGRDFKEALAESLSACNTALVLLGDDWLAAADEHGQRRLDDPEDWVRREVEAVLGRDIRVIPVLLDEAKMPREEELPEPLRPLTSRQAVKLRQDPDFDTDVERLLRHIPGAHPRVFFWNLWLVLALFALATFWALRYLDVSGSIVAGTLLGCLALAALLFKVLPERRIRAIKGWIDERIFLNPRATWALGLSLPLSALAASCTGGIRLVLPAGAPPRSAAVSDSGERSESTLLKAGELRQVFWVLPWATRKLDVAVEGLPTRPVEVSPWELATLTVPDDFLVPAALVYCDSIILAGYVNREPPNAVRCVVSVAGVAQPEMEYDGHSFYVGCGDEVGLSQSVLDKLNATLPGRSLEEVEMDFLRSFWMAPLGRGYHDLKPAVGKSLVVEIRNYPDAALGEFTLIGRAEATVEDPTQPDRFPQLLPIKYLL